MPDQPSLANPRPSLLRRSRGGVLVLIVLTLLGALAGAAIHQLRPSVSTAESSILITPLLGNPYYPDGRGDELINLETEARVLASDAVAEEVVDRANLDLTPSELLRNLSVTLPPNTQILSIKYTSGDPDVARDNAQVFAETYLDFRATRAQQVADLRAANIEAQIKSQNDELTNVLNSLNGDLGPARRSALQQQVNTLTAQISEFRAQLTELRSGGVDPGQIITPASVDPTSLLQTLPGLTAAGGIAGGLLGLMIAVAMARTRDQIRHPADIEAAGLATLGTIGETDLATARDAGFVPSPGLRELRTEILTKERQQPLRLLYATAAASTAPAGALALGRAIAAIGVRAIVVDATEAGSVGATAGGSGRPGLAETVLHAATGTTADVLHDVRSLRAKTDAALIDIADNLRLLPAGTAGPNEEDLLNGPATGAVIDQLARDCEVVILVGNDRDGTRTRALALLADVTVIEAEIDRTRRRDLSSLTLEEGEPAPILGAALAASASSEPVRETVRESAAPAAAERDVRSGRPDATSAGRPTAEQQRVAAELPATAPSIWARRPEPVEPEEPASNTSDGTEAPTLAQTTGYAAAQSTAPGNGSTRAGRTAANHRGTRARQRGADGDAAAAPQASRNGTGPKADVPAADRAGQQAGTTSSKPTVLARFGRRNRA